MVAKSSSPRTRVAPKKTTPRKPAPAKRATVQAKRAPEPAPGEQVFLLKVPYAERSLAQHGGAIWYPDFGWVYVGRTLPVALDRYKPSPYSWEAYLSGDLAGAAPGSLKPFLSNGTFTLRDDQVEDMGILIAGHAARAPEFLVGSEVGVGKTVTVIAALKRLPVRNIVVVAPLQVLAGWRLHLDQMGDGGKRWALINYESVKNLLEKPPVKVSAETGRAIKSKAGTKNRQHAKSGAPRVAWDVVVTDESHLLGNPASQRSIAIDRIIEGPAGSRPAFVVRMSATAGASPAKLAYVHRGLAWASGDPVRRSITMENYQAWCEARNIKVTTGRFDNLAWEKNDRDLLVMNRLLFGGEPRWGIRRIPEGWPEQQRIPVPIEFDFEERDAYEAAWEEFQEAMRELAKVRAGTPREQASQRARQKIKGLAAQTRYRQKAGLVRAPHTAAFAAGLVEKGYQVAINCQFTATADIIQEELTKQGVESALFTGKNPGTREQDRIDFQQGRRKVIVFSPAEGFSLHAGEKAVQGNTTPRALVVAEPRWSPTQGIQIEGRTQRNGEASLAYYPFAANTVEHKVLTTVISGMRAIKKINGDETDTIEALSAIIGFPVLSDTI